MSYSNLISVEKIIINMAMAPGKILCEDGELSEA